MADIDVRVAETECERADAFAVRRTVFVEEQGVDESIEYDDYEAESIHFVAVDGTEPIGAARLRELEADAESVFELEPESGAEAEPATESGVGKVERVAVLQSRRGDGIGRALMTAVEEHARELGFERLTLHSQTHAAAFYERLGYDRRGEVFLEAGIPHVEMSKSLK